MATDGYPSPPRALFKKMAEDAKVLLDELNLTRRRIAKGFTEAADGAGV
jgi:hypothetical protein